MSGDKFNKYEYFRYVNLFYSGYSESKFPKVCMKDQNSISWKDILLKIKCISSVCQLNNQWNRNTYHTMG